MPFLNRYIYLIIPLAFFIVSLLTIYDYGINWDSPTHFARGQAYLRYILTGKTNYNDNPSFCTNQYNINSKVDSKTGEVCDRHRKIKVSEYESNLLNYERWAVKDVYGHPAFSNLMMAISNNIFFKSLGLVEDISAYHLYVIFVTFLFGLVIAIWTKQTFGIISSIIATLVFYSFPLLFGEQHFNVKDPAMASFFTISIYFFYLSLTRKKAFFLLLSALAGGASFGTKFNFIFAPLILLPWLTIYLRSLWKTKQLKSVLTKKMLLAALAYPFIVFAVFYFTWPALWTDPIKNVPQVFFFYKDVGGSTCSNNFCLDWLPFKYILYTSQPFSLLLFGIGFFVAFKRIKEGNYVSLLWLSFFLVTILRVTLPISRTYGGIRQIMEFIGPMAMIAGLGGDAVIKKITHHSNHFNQLFKIGLITIATIFLVSPLIKYHPNENVYFNGLIGGLKGAEEKQFSGYGNTYGNAYLQGVNWLNQNAKPNAKVALVYGNTQNIPRSSLRGDLDFANGYRSAFNQNGEYQIALVTGQEQSYGTFKYQYLDIFINPVFDLRVMNVSLLKIWENSKEHLKNGINFESEEAKFQQSQEGQSIIINLNEQKKIKALTLNFTEKKCKTAIFGSKVFISSDGQGYSQKSDDINGFSEDEMAGFPADLVYLFPGDEVQFIKIKPPENYSCKISDINLKVYTFTMLNTLQ